MIDSLYIGATGMNAQQLNVDTIANNLANVNTTGFKKNRVNFEDLLYRDAIKASAEEGVTTGALPIGSGARVGSSLKIFTLGDIKTTGNPTDVAIRGAGFFEIVLPDGSFAYTRNGAMQINKDGLLTTAEGHPLKNAPEIPPDATELVIQPDGKVLVSLPGQRERLEVGEIELATFINPSSLRAQGDGIFVVTPDTAAPTYAKPGEDGTGALAQTFLESSNVKLIEELIGLVVAQRAYEINSKVVQASDEMMGMANNLRR